MIDGGKERLDEVVDDDDVIMVDILIVAFVDWDWEKTQTFDGSFLADRRNSWILSIEIKCEENINRRGREIDGKVKLGLHRKNN